MSTNMWMLFLTATILSVIQIQDILVGATGCNIQTVTSSSASTLNIAWDAYPDATSYQLELRVINSTSIAAVIVSVTVNNPSQSTQKLVQGLRPGNHYDVTLKVLKFLTVVSTCKSTGMTVPATVQITTATAASSSSISFQWSTVTGADTYTVWVEQLFASAKFSKTFTTLSGTVDNLSPSTTYNCYIIASNSAGNGAKGSVRTITTLIQPPTGVTVTATGKSTATVTWNALSGVIMYEVTVTDTDLRNSPVLSRTSSTSMNINNLEPCSNYTVGVSSLDSFLVAGEPNEVSYITSTINPVTTITAHYNCSMATVTVTWDLVFGANSYMATATDGTGEILNCTSTSTSCDINTLKCGEKYTVQVTVISDDCNNTSTISKIFDTVPCAPANPQINYTCSSSAIIFQWEHTNNTLFYVAKSTDMNGQVNECRTLNNMCFFTNVGCGENYTYTVQAISECNSEISTPKFIQTSPCLPQNIKTAAECTSDRLTTTWDYADGALYYTVEVLGNIDIDYNCTSTTNSCVVEGVPCGEQLSVWVTASNAECTTPQVLGEVAQTDPCPPTDVSVSSGCISDSATINWTISNGVVFYIATAVDLDGNTYSCYSMGTDCLLENLRCAQSYNVTVVGTNLKCNSTESIQATFDTGPCPPNDVTAQRDCDNNEVTIAWGHQSTGLFTASIQDNQNGDSFNCTSSTQKYCTISSPPCGKTYTVTVEYNHQSCPSSSAPVTVDSVPCKPENVSANVTCITGELTVTWTNPANASEYVTKISGGTPAETLYCNSTTTQCVQTGLQCASSYVVTVYSIIGSCTSLPSEQVTVTTLPCPPTGVSAQKACLPNHSTVTWVASSGANHYTAKAVSADGSYRSECSSSQTTCSFSDLICGQNYTIGVSGVGALCTGAMSSTVSLSTEPCSPTNVTSQVDCHTGSAVISWDPSTNAANYSVTATSSGSPVNCYGPTPSCTLNNLNCDQQYEITVTASDVMCTSNHSTSFTQDPVPCAPQNVQTSLSCSSNNVVVTWNPVSVSWDFNATAVTSSGQSTEVTCTTKTNSCTLTALQCGQDYNVTVKAFSGTCVGPESSPVTVTTAPCTPRSLMAAVTCGTNAVNASWSTALGATSYIATASGPNGFSSNCSSSSLTCQITGLQCATQYNVSAISENNDCSSSPTQAVTITTGPCDPANVNTALICGSGSATVSWDAASGADAYTVLASETGSAYETSCKNTTTSCQLNQLNCGKSYTLTVLSENAICNSTGTTETLDTAPCSPTIQTYSLNCGTNTSSVTWTDIQTATGYTVRAATAKNDVSLCTSTTANCTLTDLLCSENYTATVTAQGSDCDSAPSSSFTITTAPCPPSITSTQYVCSSSTATVSWSEPAASTGFHAEVVGDHTAICDSTNTSCEFSNLPCGLNLHINVKAKGSQCDSENSVGETFETAPCAPENVVASLVCENSALVNWSQIPLAVNYTVTATSQNDSHHCHIDTKSCMVPNLQCGENYNITVTSHSATCTGLTSDIHIFQSGLCAPTSASVSSGCQASTVTWDHVDGAEKVVATATDENGQTYTCESSSSDTCNFTDLPCGGNFSVTVVTVDRGCNSLPTSAGRLIGVQCPPTNVVGSLDCGASTATLTWNQSSLPGTTYSIERVLIGAAADVFTASHNIFTQNNLPCGESYNYSIAAVDGNCFTAYTPPIQINTAPCEPTTFTAHVDCGTNNGNFSWSESKGATQYTVEVTGEQNHHASCSSSGTSCLIKLDCGRFYSATLMASTESCNTTKQGNIVIESAPCLPENVMGVVDCDTNVMNITWKYMPVPDNYTAWAISTDGHNASCLSTSNFCTISNLECGRVYDVVVSASSISNCDIIVGSDYKVQSAPCKPENMNVDLNCSANAVTVSWNQTNTNQNNTVTAASATGESICRSPDTSCTLLDLSCGAQYTFTVQASTNVCSSIASTMVKTTAPCAPTNVLAQLNCSTKDAVVTWDDAAAAESYHVYAQSSDHSSTCSNTARTCNLQQLVCGQEYTVNAEAVNAGCTGPASNSTTVKTEPCVPVNLTVAYSVGVAQVQWAAAQGADEYSVKAVEGAHHISNSSSSTQSVLNGLLCGKTYNITVTAHNTACLQGVMSEKLQLITEPCPPTNVQANMQCQQNGATVSWDSSDNAESYFAFFQNGNNHNTFCDTPSTSCAVTGLDCGTVYRVWAIAVGHQYNSSASSQISLTSGPCEPSNINVTVDCEAKTATISWQPSNGALSNVATLTSSSHNDTCSSSNSSCQPSHLHCGEEYSVSVTALGQSCNSTGHMAANFYTEPCKATNVLVGYNVGTALVQWDSAHRASSYSVEAVTDQGATSTCNNTNTQCTLTGLQCSEIYNVTVTAQNQVCNQGVTSDTAHLTTEPCPPTNIQATMACEQLEATISWTQSNLAVGYVAYINKTNGHKTCDATSAGTFCVVTGLDCGLVYSAWVVALGDQYNSSESEVIWFTSAPCLPPNIGVHVNCSSDGGATVSWTANAGANFSVTAVIGGNEQTLCTTQQNSCVVSGLSCGQTYNLSLTATNNQCNLTVPTQAELSTRPCAPLIVSAALTCGSRSAVVTWLQSADVELYTVTATSQSGGQDELCNSTASTCQFSNLPCGESYTVIVKAYSNGCWSQASSPASIKTEPCQPVIISAEAVCQNEDVQISWHPANGAVSYLITASGDLGFNETFNTNQTQLSATVPCGQNYSVTIQAQGSQCVSTSSSPSFVKTTPCIPQNVVVVSQCQIDSGSVRWRASNGTIKYNVTASGLNGHMHECVTNLTSCAWADLHCGEEYTVTIKAMDDRCTSVSSDTAVIYMSPCVPQNLFPSVNCGTENVSLSWDPCLNTHQYNVTAEDSNSGLTTLTTSTTIQSFTSLVCGKTYNLTVTPLHSQCTGTPASTTISTWPCPLTGLSASHDCLWGNVTVSWQSSAGADQYVAMLDSGTGISENCTSVANTCSVSGLACGHNFSVSVTASNAQCTVTSTKQTSQPTAPCVPTNVAVVMDCSTNTAAVSWAASQGALEYTVTGQSSQNIVTCDTSGLTCSLTNLTCGTLYTIQVVARDNTCSSAPSQAVTQNSAPCAPENVNASIQCVSNDLTVSWDSSAHAEHYLVLLTAQNGGVSESCNTTNTGCTFNRVSCGNTFVAAVTSVRGTCRSPPSHTASAMSAPCPPQGINGSIDCVTNSAWISWDSALGADSYTVLALGDGGRTANCTSSTNTTCEVELHCAVMYNFTVTATNTQCESPPSAHIDLETGPCSLTGIRAFTQCQNSSILVKWDVMDGGTGDTVYIATAGGNNQSVLSCNNTGTSCFLQGAQCGLQYTIIVSASSDICNDMRSPPYRITTEPCSPSTPVVVNSCGDALVSWDPSPVAETYHVFAEGDDGHRHTCNTTFSNCILTALHCDQNYSVHVIASHENCSSNPSQSATLKTGPCKPDNVSVTYDCTAHSALLTWIARSNAGDYYASAQDENGNMMYCHSTSPSCGFGGLQCGSLYNFTVLATDGACNSSYSEPIGAGAVPCPPETVDVQLLPQQNGVQILSVSWTQSNCSNTEYMVKLTGNLMGNTATQFDISSYWTSETFFELPLPCSSEYWATVESRNSAGTSNTSKAVSGTTAPCPPTSAVYTTNSTSLHITWSPSQLATGYTVYEDSVSPRIVKCTTNTQSCTLTNYAHSSLVVTANNSGRESEGSAIVPGSRRRRRDNNELMLTVSQMSTPTSLYVSWTADDDYKYSLIAHQQGSITKTQKYSVYGGSLYLFDLPPSTSYCFTVAVMLDAHTRGPKSGPVCTQTGSE